MGQRTIEKLPPSKQGVFLQAVLLPGLCPRRNIATPVTAMIPKISIVFIEQLSGIEPIKPSPPIDDMTLQCNADRASRNDVESCAKLVTHHRGFSSEQDAIALLFHPKETRMSTCKS